MSRPQPRVPSAPPAANLLQQAIGLHQAGQVAAAQDIYARILALEPENIDTLYLDGLACQHFGRHEEALDRFNAALRAAPAAPLIHTALGNLQRDRGNFDLAEACYQAALRLDPDNADTHYNLGIARHERGDFEGAIAAYRHAAKGNPAHAETWINLGVALKAVGRIDEAAACYAKAIACQPGHATAHYNLGVLHADAGRYEEAIACYGRALAAQPAYADAAFNLAVACKNLGRQEDARQWFERTLALQPGHAGAMQNLGAVAYELGHLDEAETRYRQALELAPDNPALRYNLALIALACGDYPRGWVEFEWRWSGAESSRKHKRNFSQPQWCGENIAGQTLLLHAEQGLGDTMQFARYAPLAAARGARVVLECQRPLVRLLEALPGVTQVVAAGEALPDFAWHCPLMSLPRAFGTTLDTIPAQIPYLHANPADVAAWSDLLAPRAGLRVGIVWAGNPREFSIDLNLIDRRRSLHLSQLAPLLACTGVTIYSLQLGAAAAQLQQSGMQDIIDLTGRISDFADTAAFVANLDLLISVDTSVVHLAGALGKPVWLLSRYDACWRWLRDRDDSPWYPDVRIFRQPASGDWGVVTGRIAACLAELAASANTRNTPS